MSGIKVLSLFDGMACGMIAFRKLGAEIDRYVAYEIDKYARKTAKHNFPMIEERGDVFTADFSEFAGFDYIVGGSPCTYWSIAQKNNRETEASGIGWELFWQYVKALREAKPKYFLYENNKSMSGAIRRSISEAFGFEPICINSALLSAQNRQRLYWVGRRNLSGSYDKVDIKQPQDRGIYLRDVIEGGYDLTGNDKSYVVTASYDGAVPYNTIERKQRNMVAVPINMVDGKARTLCASYHKQSENNLGGGTGFGASGVAEPVCVAMRGRNPDNPSSREAGECLEQRFEAKTDGKTNVLTSVAKDNMVAEPTRVGTYPSEAKNKESKQYRIYDIDGKSTTLCGQGGGMGAKTGLYAVPVEWSEDGYPIKAVSLSDGKEHDVYKVENGVITTKSKTYPIKLADGYYIIRKLTVRECMRLQTVPKSYEFNVSDTQAYKMLGNGWTCDVISYLLWHTMEK